jgi:hypothetical protein
MFCAQASRIIIRLAILLVALSCASGEQSNPDIEFRVIEDKSCEECSRVNFENVFTSNELRIHVEPNFLLTSDSISRIEMVRFDNRIEGRIVWKAEIWMDREARQRQMDYRKNPGWSRELFLASVKERPLEVIIGSQLIDGVLLGSFKSEEELRSVFPRAVNEGKTEELEGSQEFNDLIERFEAAKARGDADSKTIDEMLKALAEDDEEKIEKLKSELFR